MERVESGREINTITAISILTGATTDLYSDSDFVGEPHISPDGTEVAFLTWNLPYMAWEESCIKVGGFAPNGSLSDIQSLPHRPGESHAQPIWSPGGKLFYSSDRSGYWNIYSRNSSDPLHEIAAESSLPLWSLGVSQYAFRNDYKLVVSYQVRGLSELWEIDLDSGAAVRIRCESTSISQLRPLNGEVAAVGAGATKPAHVMIVGRSGLSEVYAVPAAVKADLFSVPHEVTVPSQDGNIFGLYYPPTNPNFKVSQEPPVILMIHGGPTNCAVPELSMRKLYFTSRGFGVFDVNYRGSSGFGRKFRERLNGLWMVADVEDCIASATELKRQKLASDDLFIRGSSAGGATALLSLSKSKVFKGAGIYYPVTNLLDLNEHSPKFESGYVVGLVGPASNTQLYKQRSPISCVQDLAVAPVFFHGLEDRVCLPSSTIAYVDALKKYGLSAELHLYQNEGHSFRSGEVLSDALDKELRYYQGLL
jgi:dipeptidyl aminopeptidase/acylaminoacyl peptidase